MADDDLTPNGSIILGLVLIGLGIMLLKNLPHATRVKEIGGAIFIAPAGLLFLILGLIKKFRKPKGP